MPFILSDSYNFLSRHTPLISIVRLPPTIWVTPSAPLSQSTWTTWVCVATSQLLKHDCIWACPDGSALVGVCCISDRPAPRDQVTADDLPPPSVANGTTPQSEENGSNGETGTTSHAIFLIWPNGCFRWTLAKPETFIHQELNVFSQGLGGKPCPPPIHSFLCFTFHFLLLQHFCYLILRFLLLNVSWSLYVIS